MNDPFSLGMPARFWPARILSWITLPSCRPKSYMPNAIAPDAPDIGADGFAPNLTTALEVADRIVSR